MLEVVAWIAIACAVLALLGAIGAARLAVQNGNSQTLAAVDRFAQELAELREADASREIKYGELAASTRGVLAEAEEVLDQVTKKERQARGHANRANGAVQQQQADPRQAAIERARGLGYRV